MHELTLCALTHVVLHSHGLHAARQLLTEVEDLILTKYAIWITSDAGACDLVEFWSHQYAMEVARASSGDEGYAVRSLDGHRLLSNQRQLSKPTLSPSQWCSRSGLKPFQPGRVKCCSSDACSASVLRWGVSRSLNVSMR